MTDRYSSLTVVLERDIRDDDAEPLIAAIRQLRGVLRVVPKVADAGEVARQRAPGVGTAGGGRRCRLCDRGRGGRRGGKRGGGSFQF